jgi:hypothetical protein
MSTGTEAFTCDWNACQVPNHIRGGNNMDMNGAENTAPWLINMLGQSIVLLITSEAAHDL